VRAKNARPSRREDCAASPDGLAYQQFQVDWLIRQIGERDQFVFHDAQTGGTQYGDYRVDGSILTATGFSADR
jgi:type III restriction enzyme